jgi:hypothetical protein
MILSEFSVLSFGAAELIVVGCIVEELIVVVVDEDQKN